MGIFVFILSQWSKTCLQLRWLNARGRRFQGTFRRYHMHMLAWTWPSCYFQAQTPIIHWNCTSLTFLNVLWTYSVKLWSYIVSSAVMYKSEAAARTVEITAREWNFNGFCTNFIIKCVDHNVLHTNINFWINEKIFVRIRFKYLALEQEGCLKIRQQFT